MDGSQYDPARYKLTLRNTRSKGHHMHIGNTPYYLNRGMSGPTAGGDPPDVLNCSSVTVTECHCRYWLRTPDLTLDSHLPPLNTTKSLSS